MGTVPRIYGDYTFWVSIASALTLFLSPCPESWSLWKRQNRPAKRTASVLHLSAFAKRGWPSSAMHHSLSSQGALWAGLKLIIGAMGWLGTEVTWESQKDTRKTEKEQASGLSASPVPGTTSLPPVLVSEQPDFSIFVLRGIDPVDDHVGTHHGSIGRKTRNSRAITCTVSGFSQQQNF